MKVRITIIKGPWPEGAAVGDLVEVKGDVLPDSLVGKCTIEDPDEKAAHVFAPKPPKPVSHEPAASDKTGDRAAKALGALEAQIKTLAESMAKANEAAAALVATLEAASKKDPAK